MLGKTTEARHSLSEAVAQAPQAYEDHASTLRQFCLILDFRGEDRAWLDDFRPPRCLHFAGPLALARSEEKRLAKQIRAVLHEERVGAGFGALAAGADILVAEALLEANAELHLVLPAPLARFRETSVAKYGARWGPRFDRVADAAASIRMLPEAQAPFSMAIIRLAAEIGMGRAAMQAEMLQTEAIQLVVLAKNAAIKHDPSSSGWIARHWRASGRREHVLRTETPAAHSRAPAEAKAPQVCLAAMLRIEFGSDGAEATSKYLRRLAMRLPSKQALIPPRWTGEAVTLAYPTAGDVARAAFAIMGTTEMTDLRIAAHYGIGHRLMDPFSHTRYLAGAPAELSARIMPSTPMEAFYASEDFAAALHAASGERRTEYVGDLPTENSGQAVRLYGIRR